MTEYTGSVRIKGGLEGAVRVVANPAWVWLNEDGTPRQVEVVIPAADLLGWLRATLPLKDDDLPTAIAILKWAEQQHIRHDGLVERLQALQAALSTPKEGENGAD